MKRRDKIYKKFIKAKQLDIKKEYETLRNQIGENYVERYQQSN